MLLPDAIKSGTLADVLDALADQDMTVREAKAIILLKAVEEDIRAINDNMRAQLAPEGGKV